MIIQIKVIPNSQNNEVFGMYGDAVKIKIAAPPEKNAANLKLIQFLSEELDIPQGDIKVLSGFSSRNKRIEVSSIDEETFFNKLGVEKTPQNLQLRLS